MDSSVVTLDGLIEDYKHWPGQSQTLNKVWTYKVTPSGAPKGTYTAYLWYGEELVDYMRAGTEENAREALRDMIRDAMAGVYGRR